MSETLRGAARDWRDLADVVSESRYVLLGEASHGTHEFYETRAELTKTLIEEHGFAALAVEADWPDAYRVNRYVLGRSDATSADDALSGFRRFPTWMWRNEVVLELVEWLREHNEARSEDERVGFYGLDLYSLNTSMDAVVRYLEEVSPEAAERARQRYACFGHARDAEEYAYSAGFGAGQSCEDAAVAQLVELQRNAARLAAGDGASGADELFSAEQNARLVRAAEEYYRTMFRGAVSSWNLRDTHMFETLIALSGHLGTRRPRPKIVVWAHNSHLGDARATQLGDAGELNLGQLVRERLGGDSYLVGFTTYRGTVTAASAWGGDAERKRVRDALPESHEAKLHEVGLPSFALRPRDGADVRAALAKRRLERAIGVVYLPQTERQSHYFGANLARQFDVVIHFDETCAVEPLERTQDWLGGEPAETYPTGL
ncbi:MAG: erythromycin esterase family protein [Actinomycetota bacterium]|nr:erythromycin esterase family protein [Actinomycetota bacterium]